MPLPVKISDMNKKLRNFIAVSSFLCATIITAGSLLPQLSTPTKYNLDKLVHGASYALLIFFAFLCTTKRTIHITLFILIIIMGGAIEVIQSFIPARSGTIGDFAADIVGVTIGALLALKLRPYIIKWFN